MKNVGLIALVFCFFTMAVSAEIITVQVTAEIAQFDDYGDAFGGGISVGNTLVMTYSYDTETPNSNPYSPPHPAGNNGIYSQSVPNMLSAVVGGYSFQSDINNLDYYISLSRSETRDTYYIHSANNITDTISNNFLIYWQLDYAPSTFVNADLPTTVPDIISSSVDYGIVIDGDHEFYIKAIPVSVEIIPEPITLLTLGIGSLMVIRNRKK